MCNIRYLGGFWVSLEFTDTHVRDSFKRHKGMDTWFSVIQPWKNDFGVDERVLGDVEGIPSVVCGVKGKGSSESDGKRDMDNNNGDVGEVKSDDPFGIYNFLNHEDKNKEGEPLVSDDLSKPPGFSKIIVEDNIVSGKEYGQENINGSTQETFSKPLQASRHVEKEQQSECDMSSVKGGGGSDKDSTLPKGKYPRIALSLLKKMNEFVEIRQDMRFSMDRCINDIEKLNSRKEMEHTKMEEMDDMVVRSVWGNMDFEYSYIPSVGKAIVMGDFNEVHFPSEIHGSVFNRQGASLFNSFINTLNLIDVPLGGFPFTWAVKDATKMSLILARHLFDHRPIILRECDVYYGPIPFKTFHLWFDIEGFEQLVKDSWHNDVVVDLNEMSYMKKKFQMLKTKIKIWVQQNRVKANDKRNEIQEKLHNIDKQIDQEDLDALREEDLVQKAKVIWTIEGDKNSKVMVGSKMNPIHTWDLIIDKVVARLSKWKAKMLSIGGVLKRLESCRSSFFRGMEPGTRKVSWFSWDSVVASIEARGLENWLGEDECQGGSRRYANGRVNQLDFFVRIHYRSRYWMWNLDGEGVFSVSSARRFIDEGLCVMDRSPTRWLKLIPIKVNVLAWRLALNKLPTRFNMSLRGLEVLSFNCPVCHEGVETSDHLFFSCLVASSIVARVLGWWGLPNISISSYQGW
ncbi:RNA-directed DNA polymerase, eukaryota [Tanacetum coccineum]